MDTTRDKTTGARIVESGQDSRTTIKLSGEFDLCNQEALRRALDDVSGSGLSTYVDLSEVTFLDVRCARDLASRSRFSGRFLTLCNPSWQAESSLRACSLGDRTGPCPAGGLPPPTEAPKRTEREPRQDLALAV